ncbi:hypothetical protein IAR55_003289 [Kwoniella newhampshirensis]|uniref:SMP domain-containing protein n=1 Tax=Kwoniella newhampshirensis TaxID=1651941 RepID=A0AAW0YM44_9TREE
MGNCFSDPSKPPGKGQVLGSGPPSSQQQQQQQQLARPIAGSGTTRYAAPPRTLSDSPITSDGDPRERALKAAEERAKAAQGKGINSSNPKAGQLSSKLASERKNLNSPTNAQEDRLMDRGQWN